MPLFGVVGSKFFQGMIGLRARRDVQLMEGSLELGRVDVHADGSEFG
jgi:hypothetical protein